MLSENDKLITLLYVCIMTSSTASTEHQSRCIGQFHWTFPRSTVFRRSPYELEQSQGVIAPFRYSFDSLLMACQRRRRNPTAKAVTTESATRHPVSCRPASQPERSVTGEPKSWNHRRPARTDRTDRRTGENHTPPGRRPSVPPTPRRVPIGRAASGGRLCRHGGPQIC